MTDFVPGWLDLFETTGYNPHPHAVTFHDSSARFRFIVWGIKGGKTFSGAHDFCEQVANRPGLFTWIVAPTYGQLDTCEREIQAIFEQCEDAGRPVLAKRRLRTREYILHNGTTIICKTAEHPNHLRGANVHLCWVDEAAFIKDAAWHQIKQRIAATQGEVIATTTPDGRNWLWTEAVKAGMPADDPYGTFFDHEGKRFVSHYPTWEFPWVPPDDIDDARSTMPAVEFERDYGARFRSSGQAVIRYIEEALHARPLRRDPERRYVLGVDLAKHQDWTVIIAMDGSGWVMGLWRWTGVDWTVQKRRIAQLSKEWQAVVVLDHSNVGSSIADDFRAMNVQIHPIEWNSPQVKMNLIHALQSTFDGKAIHIPDPRAPWCGIHHQKLKDELAWFKAGLTKGGRVSYSAPKGLTDDCVAALAMANWGKMHGLAGGGVVSEDVTMARDEYLAATNNPDDFTREIQRIMKPRRSKQFSRIFGRRSRSGLGNMSGPLWH